MKHIILLILIILSIGKFEAQDDQTVMTIFGRICQTDSIRDALSTISDDSTVLYHFKTPDVDKYGIFEFEFEDFIIIFDTGSNLLFSGKSFASIDQMKISGKKAEILLRLEGLGDRKKNGKFETATYFFIQKNYKWMLKNIKYD